MKNLTANTYRNLSTLAFMMLGLLLWLPVQIEAGTIQRISVNNNGEEANGDSSQPFISDNGRFVVFESSASNLAEDDINGRMDVFVYDLLENKIERISVDSDGDGKINFSSNPSISGEGRYVAFSSHYTSGGFSYNDLVVYDRQDNVIAHKIEKATGKISADGKYMSILTSRIFGENVPNDYNSKIYLYDMDSGSTKFVSFYSSTNHSISGDGRFIVFESSEAMVFGIEPNDESKKTRGFVYDRILDSIIKVSVDNEGNELDYGSDPKISTNGRYVAFTAHIGNWKQALFVHDLQTNIITRISDGYPGGGRHAISGNGNYVIFYEDVIYHNKPMVVYSLQTGEKTKLPIYMRSNEHLSISGDGRYIAFPSGASDLVENDTNGKNDIFVYDMGAGSIVTISGKIHSPNNQPLANVALCIDGIDNCETSTDATGNFTLTREFRDGLYLITPRYTEASGVLKFTPQSRWLNVTGKPIENINFIATPYNPNPHIYVSTNAIQFSAESPNIDVDIRMDFEGDEPIEKFYDVYVVVGVVDAPVEAMLFHDGQAGFQNTLTPYVENKRITPTDGEWETIFTYSFDKNVPSSDYFVHVGLVDKDNGELVAEDRVEVNYTPEPKPLYVVEQGVARIPAPKSELPANPEQTANAELETYLLEKNGNSEEAKQLVKLGADTTLALMIATLDHRGLKMFKRANGILNEMTGAGIAYLDYDTAASTGEINTHQRDMLFGVYVLGKLLEKANLYSIDPKDLADGIKRIFVASNEHKRTLASVATAGGVSFPTDFKFGHIGFFSFMDEERELKVKLNALIIFDDDLETPKQIMNENNVNKMYACQFQVQSKGYKFGVMLPDPGLYLVTAKDQTTSQVRQQTIIIDGADVSVQFDYGKAGTGEWDYNEVQKCHY
jgi:Tol biopolymer transport system component